MPDNGTIRTDPEKVLQDFSQLVGQHLPDVVTAIVDLGAPGDLDRRHETLLSIVRFQLQSLVHDIDRATLGSVTETPQTPAGQTPAGQTPAGQIPAGQTPASQTPASQPPAKPGRAPAKTRTTATRQEPHKQLPSFGYDYLLLDAFRHRDRLELPTSLSYLHDLACAYDPNVKRRSLSAKLNRWKHELGYVSYDRSTLIEITDAGKQHRDDLLQHVRAEKTMDRIQRAFEQTTS